MGKVKTFLTTKFPKFLLVLVFTELWERYSYYTMRGILTLYMTNIMLLPDDTALRIYSLMTSIGNMLPIIYGLLADQLFGFKMMMTVGAFIIIIGHLIMVFSLFSNVFFYLALGLVATGTGFFKGNVQNLLGACYDKLPTLDRVSGFTLFYAGINLGAFSAFLSAGYVAEYISFHFAFSLAGFGMIIGLIIFYLNKKIFLDKDTVRKPRVANMKFFGFIGWGVILFAIGLIVSVPIALSFFYADFMARINITLIVGIIIGILLVVIFLTVKGTRAKKNYLILIVYYIFLMIFFILELQLGSLFVLFVDRNVHLYIGALHVPASVISTVNPAVIMTIGFLLSSFYKHTDKFDLPRIGAAVLSNTICFLILYWGTLNADPETALTTYFYPVFGIIVMATGEVFMSPVLQAATTVYAPRNKRGIMMGIYVAMQGFAGLFGFIISNIFNVPTDGEGNVNPHESLQIYKDGFILIALANLVCFAVFLLFCPVVYYLKKPTAAERAQKLEIIKNQLGN